MNYITEEAFKIKSGRFYQAGTVITQEEYDTLDEESQGHFEETNITDIGQTEEQADAAQEAFEKQQEAQDKAFQDWQKTKEKQDERMKEQQEKVAERAEKRKAKSKED